MNIPGMTASHQIITHTCRANRGDGGAFEEAVSRIRDQYADIVAREPDPTTELHLLLVVQTERHRDNEVDQ